MTYRIFTRRWWRANKNWPNGLEPHAGKQRTIGQAMTEDEAIKVCRNWNETHSPGLFSRKAEFEEIGRHWPK